VTLFVVAVFFCATLVRSALGFGEALIAVPLVAFVLPSRDRGTGSRADRESRIGGAYGMNGPPLVAYGSLRRWTPPERFRATLQGYFLPARAADLIGWVPSRLKGTVLATRTSSIARPERITMPIELHHERDNIFRIDLRAMLRQDEFERCQNEILHEASRVGPVRVLFVLDRFEGWDSKDDWRDLSFFVRHGDAIERIAIVGDERWRDLALMFAAADLRKAPVEYFTEHVEARSWLNR